MEVHVEKLSPVLVEFQIEVPADHVTREVDKAFAELKKTARVRGFRRGKAPRQVLVQLYGRAVHADVAQRLMDSSLQKALDERSMQPLTRPAVEPSELKPAASFSFKARFEVRPDIAKVEWQGLEATRDKVEVKPEHLQAEIERLRGEHATMEPIEGRAAEKGDIATMSLSFSVGGKNESEDLDAELGAGQVLPDIDAAVMGMNVGEEKDQPGRFPDGHNNPAIRGQSTTFHIKLVELKRRVLPSVDDEFAKDCEHEDLDAMKKSLSEKIEGRLKQEADERLARELVSRLCEKNAVDVPGSLVEQQTRISERELRMLAQMAGQRLDESTFGASIRADAEMKVRAGLLMAEIAKEKEVKVTEEDLEKGYEELAAQTGKNVAKVRAEYREKSKREMLIGMILEDKVLDLLEKAATIRDGS